LEERVCKDWQYAGYERVLVAYSVVFGGVSRDWCVSMGVDGYMLTNTTTPDGCMINADGLWVQ